MPVTPHIAGSDTGRDNLPNRPLDAVGSEPDERTRDRVLAAVLEHGPVSAAELGETLGFTPAAMRRHLDALFQYDLIEVKRAKSAASGAGRPARRYVLSQRGQSKLGNDYLDIAKAALGQLGTLAGPGAVHEFARSRFAGMEERYRPLVEAAGPSPEDRALALSGALSADGFASSTKTVGSNAGRTSMLSVQLCQGHCPIQELAAEFPAFCDEETQVFSRLLGVDVRRLSTLARGGHVCTTHIPVGRVRPTVTAAEPHPGAAPDPGTGPDQGPGTPPEFPQGQAALSIHQQGRP
ncbi:helix-turn-helix domain-containing protein [Arthrobacter sp. Br18]|uniref:helix-turn-helix transcriptional regulator n=1 Tax=Arthrobacter sp. Br18 TaxID=1312954 RepID=UPI0004AE785D|nr:helix-turn-helix domain-containing protein [Arthrobacter sp. Br18]